MKISASTVFLTLAIQIVAQVSANGLAILGGATAAQAGPTRIALPETTPQNSPTPSNPSPEVAPVIIPVPAPRQPAAQPAVPPASGGTTKPTKSATEIVSLARTWKGTPYRYAGDSRNGIDCSHFVFAIYSQAVPGFGYRMAREYLNDPQFTVVTDPQPGDIIVFPGYRGSSDHVGIVTDAQAKMFIGSQSSTGVAETSFGPNTYYWGKRPYKIVRIK
jgi:cell wall-associated NlpC family hydrolase